MLFNYRKLYTYKGVTVEVLRTPGQEYYRGHIIGIPNVRKSFRVRSRKNIKRGAQECIDSFLENPDGELTRSVLKLPPSEFLKARESLNTRGKICYYLGTLNWDLTRIRVLHPAGFLILLSWIVTVLPLAFLFPGIGKEAVLDSSREFCLWN